MKFIMCAGFATRWQYHVPKQLISVQGEQLLFRTQRLLEGTGVVVTSNRLVLKHCRNMRTLVPVKQSNILQSIQSTMHLWEDVNTFYLGDVYFTDSCVDVIEHVNLIDIHFIGSTREIYAVTMRNTDKVKKSLEVCARLEDARLWTLYYYTALNDSNPGKHDEPVSNGVFTVIDDETRDFDYYSDYINYRRKGKL